MYILYITCIFYTSHVYSVCGDILSLSLSLSLYLRAACYLSLSECQYVSSFVASARGGMIFYKKVVINT
jgi:hypothetical protein